MTPQPKRLGIDGLSLRVQQAWDARCLRDLHPGRSWFFGLGGGATQIFLDNLPLYRIEQISGR